MSTKTRLYLLSDEEIKILMSVRKRLHSEERMNGDEMRDLGHAIDHVVRSAKNNEVTE